MKLPLLLWGLFLLPAFLYAEGGNVPESSNLPLIVIETNGQTIIDAEKITASMKIIDHGPGQINHPIDEPTDYDGPIGIEIRGAYSSSFPQKPYGIETRDINGENMNVSLLGMPEENDWLLISNYNDKSFMRNILAFDLSREMGNYAPRARLCEVIINNEYQGIYVFTEKIKRDKGRVDIAKLTETDLTGDSLTGGYIFKVDYYDDWNSWTSNYHPADHPDKWIHFVYHDPKPEELKSEQKYYLKSFVNSFEKALYSSDFKDPTVGYATYMDVPSFIDYFIIGELSRNVDAFKKSRYFYKDKDSKGGLLHAGPVWDFDWAWKNIWDCYMFQATNGSGWSYLLNDCDPWPSSPGWMVRLLQDSHFENALYDRYFELRTSLLSFDNLDAYLDSVSNLVSDAQVRHYQKWPILGQNVGAPEVDAAPSTYFGEVEKLRSWIKTRINWLDQHMFGEPTSTDELTQNLDGLRVFPNPATDVVYIESQSPISQIRIFNMAGQPVFLLRQSGSYSVKIDLNSFSSGIYFTKVIRNNKSEFSTKLIVE